MVLYFDVKRNIDANNLENSLKPTLSY